MSARNFQDVVSCSICLGLFQEPVSIHCGHSFCRACITQNWQGVTTNFSCPQCMQTAAQQSLRPNHELAEIVEAAKSLKLKVVHQEVEGEENLCKEHQEALKLFCKEEQKLLCVVCDKSKVHCHHSVVPLCEAAQEYKEQIQTQLQHLKSEQKDLQHSLKVKEDHIQEYSKRKEAETQQIVSLYKQLQEALEEQESSSLADLNLMDTGITYVHQRNCGRLLEESTKLEALIKEMERMCQQPDFALLKDIKTIMSRCEREKFSEPLDLSPELEKKFFAFTEKIIQEAPEKFKEIRTPFQSSTFFSFLETLDFCLLPPPTQLTLDPKTAKGTVYFSEDHKVMWWRPSLAGLFLGGGIFQSSSHVLASEGFTSGQHCWEVEVCRRGMWSIGVARGPKVRKNHGSSLWNEKVWALRYSQWQYKAVTPSDIIPLTLPKVPERVRVFLDYEKEKVMWFDAVSGTKIFDFPEVSFQGEKVYPWFSVDGAASLRVL